MQQLLVHVVEAVLLAGGVGVLGKALAGRGRQRSAAPGPARPALPGDASAAAPISRDAQPAEEPEERLQQPEALAPETSGLLQPAVGGSIGALQLPRWRDLAGHSEAGHHSKEGHGCSSEASPRSSGDSSSASSSEDSEAAGSRSHGAMSELTADAIDTAAWGCFAAEERSQEAVWTCRVGEAQAAAHAAGAGGAPPDWLCCRALPRNLRSLHLTDGGSGLAAAGLEVLVPD